MNNNEISRRTALKYIGIGSVSAVGIISGISSCNPKKEEVISYNEEDIITCNALDCPDSGCKSNNDKPCCPSSNNASCDDNKKERCDCKCEPYCPANIYISEHFILFNECVKEGNLPDLSAQNLTERGKDKLKKQCRAFLFKMNKIPKNRRAELCTKCGDCNSYCEHIEDVQEKILYIADLIKQVESIK
jgi:hypothetical protein